jgi:hypothetical protein
MLRAAVRRGNRFGPRNVEWCEGDHVGYVSVHRNAEAGTDVLVQCNQCASGKWGVSHYRCEECASDRYATSCVRTEDNGYRVIFTCDDCGHSEVHVQWSD